MSVDSEMLNFVLNTTSFPFPFPFSYLSDLFISSLQETETLSCFSCSKPYFQVNYKISTYKVFQLETVTPSCSSRIQYLSNLSQTNYFNEYKLRHH